MSLPVHDVLFIAIFLSWVGLLRVSLLLLLLLLVFHRNLFILRLLHGHLFLHHHLCASRWIIYEMPEDITCVPVLARALAHCRV